MKLLRSTDISTDTFKNKLKTFLFDIDTYYCICCISVIIIIIIYCATSLHLPKVGPMNFCQSSTLFQSAGQRPNQPQR